MRIPILYLLYFQSESPSESEVNALGKYLIMCLGFVICALAEFAITLVLHQRNESKSDLDAVMKSKKKNTEKDKTIISQMTPFDAMATEEQFASATFNTSANNNVAERLMGKMRQYISNIPTTRAIDFIAVWIHFVLFLGLNIIYGKVYWIN